ncbi:MAG: hypothetical protein SH819_04085 [Cytophagales bacterium]|nr:hypothetical protein [Cytophagales bacterium]
MKTRIIILLVATGIMVSFGATQIAKTPEVKKTELQATASNSTTAPIGGLGSEDH